jgi:hypothetical protein
VRSLENAMAPGSFSSDRYDRDRAAILTSLAVVTGVVRAHDELIRSQAQRITDLEDRLDALLDDGK